MLKTYRSWGVTVTNPSIFLKSVVLRVIKVKVVNQCSTGKSSLQVVEVLRKEGMEVVGMVSIFNYGFKIADDAFAAAGIPYFSLTNYASLITAAIEKGMVNADQENTLLKWRESPSTWDVNQ